MKKIYQKFFDKISIYVDSNVLLQRERAGHEINCRKPFSAAGFTLIIIFCLSGFLTRGQNKVTLVALPATQTGVITYGSVSGATYLITLTTDGGSPDGSTGLSLTWAGPSPSGVSIAFSPTSPVFLPATSTTQNVTLTITSAAGTDAGIYNFTVSSTSDPLTSGSASFIIDQSTLIITADDQSKTYGNTLALGSTQFTAVGLVNGETIGSVTLVSAGAINTANAGNYPIIPSAATGGTFTASNYAITYTGGNLSVGAAPLTITADDQSKTYGSTLALGSTQFTATGLVNGETIRSVTLASTGAINIANVGSYPVVPSAATGGTFTASNYAITYTGGNLSVGAALLTITADDQNKTYGSTLTLGSTQFTATGLVNGETIASATLVSVGAISTANVGTYPIISSAATGGTFTASNYTITYINGNLSVGAAALTITADDRSKIYGTTLTLGSTQFTVIGLVNGETIGSVTLTSAGAINTANVGTYPVVPSAATGGSFTTSNYTITYINGNLSVTKASATISVTSGNNPSCVGSPVLLTAAITPATATGTIEFFDGPTSLGIVTISGGVATLAVSSLTVGSHALTAVYPGDLNYNLSTSPVLTQVVNPVPSVTPKTATTCSGNIFTVTPANGAGNIVPPGTTYSWAAPAVTGGLTGGASGSSAPGIAGTLINPTNSVQTATYSVSPLSGSCPGSAFTVTVTVIPAPFVIAQTTAKCSGSGFTVTPANGGGNIVPTGTTYSWAAPSVTGGLTGGTSGSGAASITGTLTNPTSNVQTATYTITPLSGSCTGSTFTVTVTVNPKPAAGAITGPSTVCIGNTISLISAATGAGALSYSWSSSAGGVATVSSAGVVSGVGAGSTNINYTVTDANGCSSTSANFVLSVTKPTANAITQVSGISAVCIGSTLNLTSNATGTGALSYTWSSSDNTKATVTNGGVVTGIAPGTVTIKYTVTDGNGCQATSPAFSVTVKAIPAGSIVVTETSGTAGNDNIICSGATVTFTATPGYAAYNFKVNGNSVQNGTSNVYSSSALTNGSSITADVANSLSCGATFGPVVITVNPLPVAGLSADKTTICPGDDVTFTASGGTNYNFRVNGSSVQNGGSNIYSSTSLANGASVTVDVTNVDGCSATSAPPVIITVNPAPIGTLNASATTICTGDNIIFTATAGFSTYEFKVNGITVQGPVASGTYSSTGLTNGQVVTVIATNSSGCSATFNPVAVSVNALPSGTLTPTENSGTPNDNSICAGANVTFTATPGFSSYDFQVNGLSKQNSASNIYNNNTLLNGDVVSVTVKNANNCIKTLNQITITVITSPSGTLSASSTTICAGDNVVFTATAGFTNYKFKVNGSAVQNGLSNIYNTTSIANGNIVVVDITNSNGCIATFGPVTMTVNTLPTGALTITENSGNNSNDGIICAGANVIFTAPSGFANYDFLLNGATIQSGTLNTYTTSSLANNNQVTVAVKNGNSCIKLLNTFTITVHPLPVVTPITGTPTVCVNSTTTLSNGTGGGVWSSLNPGIATINAAGVVTGISSGTATINYTVSDANGCTTVVTAVVTVNSLPTVALIMGNPAVCVSSSTQLSDATPGGTWSSDNTPVATVGLTGLVNGIVAGTANISYSVTNGNGCTTTVSAVVTVKALPVVAAITTTAPSFDVCAGSSIALADATAAGTWSSSNTAIATINASGLVTGVSDGTSTISYSVTTNGCTTTVNQVVMVHLLPVPTLSGPNPICPNSTDTYTTETGQTNYNWTLTGGTLISGGTMNDNTITIKWDQPGARTIFVNYQNAFGCTGATSATVTTSSGTLPTLTGPVSICLNSSGSYITQAGETAYTWIVSPGGTVTAGGTSADNTATINWNTAGAGSVSINFTDPTGCIAATPAVLPVTVHSIPTAGISSATSACLNGTAPVITFTGASGTAPYTFNYTINGGSQTPLSTTSGNSATITAPTGTAGIFTYDLVSVSDNNSCSQSQTGTAAITIHPTSSGGSAGADATVCAGANGGTINVTGETGSVIRWESSIDGGSTWVPIGNTTSSLTYSNLTQTTLYRAVVQSGVCASANSAAATITVNPVTVGGSAGTSTAVCSGSNSGTINVTGQTGSVTRWESSTDGGATWLAISNTTTLLAYNNLIQTTQYRAVVQSGACVPANSSAATVTVNTVSVGGSAGASTAVCAGTNSGTVTVTGQTGSIIRWESSTDGGTTWSSISNITASLTYNNLTQTTLYRAVVQNGGCASANSSIATVTVNAATVGGSVGTSAIVCAGVNGTTLNLTGQTGSVVRWEISIDGGTSWSPISNTTTSQSYINLTQTAQYRAVVQSGICTVSNSTAATITVNPRPTGFLSGTQGICNGGSATLTITATGSGTISGTLSGGIPFSGTAPAITVAVSPGVNTTYTIATLSDVNCVATAGDKTGSAAITVNGSTPIASVVASPSVICLGNSSNLFIPAVTSTLLSENFEGVNSFTVTNTATPGTEWTLRNSPYVYGGVTINDGSHFMFTNSDKGTSGAYPTNTTLVSPTISTVGFSALNFQYKTYYRRIPSDVAVVEVSINGGASWTVVQDVTALGTIGAANNFLPQNINLNAYIGKPSFQVRFRFTTDNQWYWGVDDIILTGTITTANYSWTATPAATAGLPANSGSPSSANASIVVTPSITGATVYTATLTNASGCTSSKNVTVTVNPLPVVTITADYCVVPGKVQLTANASAGVTYLWSTGETTQSINVDIAAVYQVTVTLANGCPASAVISVAQELVANGNFDAGNTGFISPPLGANQYIYETVIAGNLPEGLYGIGTNAQIYHSNFWGHDHTTGSGSFMIINGFPNGNPQPIIWQETVNVLPNTTYYFSGWGMSLNSVGPFAQLQFNVNGLQVGSIATLAAGTSNNSNNGWTRFYGTWLSGPTTTTAIISITDLQNQVNGNDFGLDDISFGTLSTFVELVSAPATDAQTVCANTPLTDIAYSVGSTVSGPTITGLPPGLFTSFNGELFIISGTPTVAGNYAYTITTTGTCNPSSATGTIKVQEQTINLSAGSSSTIVCINSAVNIRYTLGGMASGGTVTGLPAGVSASVAGTILTISGIPTVAGTYTYTITTSPGSGSCAPVTVTGTIKVQSQTITLSPSNASQTVCVNTPITNIQFTLGGTVTGASVTGLPLGVTGTFNSGLYIISGTPTATGIFNYTVTTAGPSCMGAQASGTIIVTPGATLNLTSGTNSQTSCKDAPITDIIYAVGNATGASVTGLPAGVTGVFNAGTFTISGVPTAGGIFNYTITTSGGCGFATATGTITVQEQTIVLTSGIISPTLCANTTMSDIVFTFGGTVTAATVLSSEVPIGTSVLNGVSTMTMNGTLTDVPGAYPYTVTTVGACAPATISGVITLLPPPVGGSLTSLLLCGGSSGNITLSGQSGTIQQWEVSTDAGLTWVPIANTTITQSYTNIMQPAMYRVVVGGSGCSPVYSSVATVSIYNLWTGVTSTDWNTASNWSGNVLPSISCPDVYIPAGTPHQPLLSSGPTATINNLHISPGATLTVNNTGILQVAGTITNGGTFDASNGTIELNGSSPQTITAGTFMNNAIKDFVISNSTPSGVTLSGPVDVYHSLTYGAAGTQLITADLLTLKSNATGTAWLGDMTGHTITGNVTVERYIPARKAWRFLAVPTQPAQTIHAAWQENQPANSLTPVGLGIQITSDRPTWAADGFDLFSPGGPAMKTYNPGADNYTGIATTNAAFAPALGGYMTFIRGDRTANAVASPVTSTVLRTQGILNTGPQTPITVIPGQVTPYNNPYAAPLDLRKISQSPAVFFYVWDPNRGGTFGFGAFQTLSWNGTNYDVVPGAGSYGPVNIDNFIESGQAFLVSGGASVLPLDETKKGIGNGLMVFRPGFAPGQQLRSNLYAVNADGSTFLADGVLSIFDDTYSNDVDGMDAKKLANNGENLSIKTAGKLLVIERKHTITSADTIFLNFTGARAQPYQFEFIADKLDKGVTAFLEDNYTQIKTPLSFNPNTLVNFTVINNPGSYAPDRFRIVFAPSVVLPVTFTSIKAYPAGKNINVEWAVEGEKNMKQYEVEKSLNGSQFTPLAIVLATANNGNAATYLSTDTRPAEGYNYYRVKSVDINGKKAYTNVVKVLMGSLKHDITIHPNPITDGVIHLQFLNQPEGRYGIRLLNKLGQVIISRQISHPEGSSTELIKWDYKLAHGIYQFEVSRPDGTIKNINLLY